MSLLFETRCALSEKAIANRTHMLVLSLFSVNSLRRRGCNKSRDPVNLRKSFAPVVSVKASGKLHRESKKQDTKLLAITLPTIIRFSNFFH